MPAAAHPKEVTLWTDARRAAGVGRILEFMGSAVRVTGVGGARCAEVAALARQLNCPAEDDFRKMVVDCPASSVLLATTRDVAATDVLAAIAGGAVVMTLEPPIASFDKLPADAAQPGAVFAPSFLRAPGWSSADPLEALGLPQQIGFTSLGCSDEGSLFARLYDAWRVVLNIARVPESIDATLTGPLAEVPDNPRALTGNLAMHARLPGGAAAVLELSDRAGHSRRRLRVLGSQGRLCVGDDDYQLFDAAGSLLDEKPAPPAPIGYVELVAAQWSRVLDRPDLASDSLARRDEASVLACCLAAMLSARTGQPESPSKLVAMR